MNTRIANPKYSRHAPDGRADNPEWKHPKSGVDLWTALIADPSQPASEKDRAAQFLKWFLARWAEHEERFNRAHVENGREDYPGRAEHNHTVARMTVEAGYLYCFWESPDQYAFSIVKGVDGERQDVVPKDQVLTQHTAPTPIPVPTFEPAVPLPSLSTVHRGTASRS